MLSFFKFIINTKEQMRQLSIATTPRRQVLILLVFLVSAGCLCLRQAGKTTRMASLCVQRLAYAEVVDALDEVLSTPVKELKGVGPKTEGFLQAIGVATCRELLLHFPNKVVDRTQLLGLAKSREGDIGTFEVRFLEGIDPKAKKSMSILEIRYMNAEYFFLVGETTRDTSNVS